MAQAKCHRILTLSIGLFFFFSGGGPRGARGGRLLALGGGVGGMVGVWGDFGIEFNGTCMQIHRQAFV